MFNITESRPVLPPDYHHPISPSQLKRIFQCTGSVEACKDIKQEVGEAAHFGRLVHEYAYQLYLKTDQYIAENCLRTAEENGVKDQDIQKVIAIAHRYLNELAKMMSPSYIEDGFYKWPDDEDRHDDPCDWAPNFIQDGVMEHRLFMPDLFYKGEQLSGTVDYAAVIPFERLIVVDLKTGMQDIQPEDNLQLMFYAAACFFSLDAFSRAVIPKIDLVIIQINDRVGVEVKTHTVTEQDLADFVSALKELVHEVEWNPRLFPGEHCYQTYCPARFTCPAYKKYVADNVGGEIIEIPKNEITEPIDFARWLNIIPAIKDRIQQIEKMALQAALDNPDLVPGWTVKQSFGHRKWENVEEAAKQMELMLGIEAYKRELVSPAQAEKLIDKKLHKKAMPATVRPDLGYKLVKKGTEDEIDKFLEG